MYYYLLKKKKVLYMRSLGGTHLIYVKLGCSTLNNNYVRNNNSSYWK